MINVIHNKVAKQINILDSRYYTNDNVSYYPGSTTILEVYPKGFGFSQWLKDVGNNASEIVERAANIGTRVHDACNQLCKGEQIEWIGQNNESRYSLEEWKMILRFKEFIQNSGAKIIKSEFSMCSDSLGFGGTIDLIVSIEGKEWLIDIKTSNYLHTSHELQVASYATLYNEVENTQLYNTGILWLKAQTRTSKIDHAKEIYQGAGWQLKTFERTYQDAYRIFEHTHNIWKEENPIWKPLNQIYPDTIKL